MRPVRLVNLLRSKAETTAWARSYRAALCRYLRQRSAKLPASAKKLGGQAADIGLEPLSVAGIHKRALKAATAPENAPGNGDGRQTIERAEFFFKETILPIEATHPAARKADARIARLNLALQRRIAALSTASEALNRATARRKSAETRTAKRKGRHDSLWAEEQRLGKRGRERLRGFVLQQESERKRIGSELRDEIIQALIGIDLGLLALNTAGQADIGKIEKRIDEAQRLLKKSVGKMAMECKGEDSR